MKQFDFKKAFKQYIAKNMKMGSCHSMKYHKTLEMSINTAYKHYKKKIIYYIKNVSFYISVDYRMLVTVIFFNKNFY